MFPALANQYRLYALQMLSTLNINPADIVSKVVTIDEVPEAVKELDQFPERYLKINVKFI